MCAAAGILAMVFQVRHKGDTFIFDGTFDGTFPMKCLFTEESSIPAPAPVDGLTWPHDTSKPAWLMAKAGFLLTPCHSAPWHAVNF